MEFMGYVRPDGKVGARNYVAVIPSVTCANDVANAICHQVQGTITYLHHQGCCQMPPDLERVTDTLISLGMSPNVGAILIVSLGCEGTDHERMYKELSATGKHVEIIHIQELGGVSKAIQLGTDIARKLVIEISGLQRQPVDVSKIVMAIKCGASDTTSGMASNCVIGYVADKLVNVDAFVLEGADNSQRAGGGGNHEVGDIQAHAQDATQTDHGFLGQTGELFCQGGQDDEAGVTEDRDGNNKAGQAQNNVCALNADKLQNGDSHTLGSAAFFQKDTHDAAEADDDTNACHGTAKAAGHGANGNA